MLTHLDMVSANWGMEATPAKFTKQRYKEFLNFLGPCRKVRQINQTLT
jgi:hypothetical protein